MSEQTIREIFHVAAQSTRIFLYIVFGVLFFVYILSGIYMISLNEVGVLQRFGRMINSHVMPGIHYAFPWPIDRIDKIQVKKVHRIFFDDFSENSRIARIFGDLTDLDSYCITGDNNIVNLVCALQFTIVKPTDYLFNIRNNEKALKNIASSTIIHTLSVMSVDEILTFGKRSIENNIKLDLQKRLDVLKTGLSIVFVELREVRPPEAVQSYFDDVINAQIDKKKFITTAESYRNEQISKANARANRLILQAEAYRQKAVAGAIGEAKRFLEQLKEAKNDLTITKRQIYMQFVKEFWPKLESQYIVEPGTAEYLRLKTY